MSDTTDGILLVGHGTRDPRGTDEFFRLAELVQSRVAPIPVAPCLLEFQRPTIQEAWNDLVGRGVRQIRVAPMLLFAAGHARGDIPEIVSELAEKSPEVSVSQCGPLSRHPAIIERLATELLRAKETLQLAESETPEVLLIGRGSRHPCATADMRVLGELVGHRCGRVKRSVCFYAMAEPSFRDSLSLMVEANPTGAIVVQPHLLFHGRIFTSIVEHVDQLRRENPGIRIAVGNYLGACEQTADAIATRALSPTLEHPSGQV